MFISQNSSPRYDLPSTVKILIDQASKSQQEWPRGWSTKVLLNAELQSLRETQSPEPMGHKGKQYHYKLGWESNPEFVSLILLLDTLGQCSLQMDDMSFWCEFLSFSNGILLQEAFLGALLPEPGKCWNMFWWNNCFCANLSFINFYNQ